MPEFISKIQHNTYEKGEFSGEKPRSLQETLELIKNFPFDAERTLTEIQLTGPSVTIQDEYLNYLKVGLYFNGKLCLYYLDNTNHLYEFYVTDISAACQEVIAFFNDALDLTKFEKHMFNIGNQNHFVTDYFEYREKLGRILILNSLILFYGFFFVTADIRLIIKDPSSLVGLIVISFSLLYYYIIIKICYSAFIHRNNYLQISKGNDVFSFGYNESEVNVYNKSDIDNIINYTSSGSRNPNLIEVYEIVFKDKSTITFSNMLISSSAFHLKFTDKMDNNYMNFIRGKKSPLSML